MIKYNARIYLDAVGDSHSLSGRQSFVSASDFSETQSAVQRISDIAGEEGKDNENGVK